MKSSLAAPAAASIRVDQFRGRDSNQRKRREIRPGDGRPNRHPILYDLQLGTAALVLGGSPLIQISGPQAGDYLVTQPSAATVLPGGSGRVQRHFFSPRRG